MLEREIPLTKYWQMRELLRCLIVITLNLITEAEKGEMLSTFNQKTQLLFANEIMQI